jgi:hypothetical protein
LKILLICFIGITFIVFLLSTSIVDTPWFSDYLKSYDNEMEIFIYLIDIQRVTSLLLTSFLIGQASYFIKLNGDSKRKIIELSFGLFFGSIIINQLLISYVRLADITKFLKTQKKPYELKAENTLFTAVDIYYKYGILIEYYDCNKTKHKYIPTEQDKKFKKEMDSIENSYIKQQNRIPFYLVISFLVMIYSYYLGNRLARKKT